MSHQQNPDVSVRRRFDAQEKVVILRQHLVEKVPVSEVCDQHGLNPTIFYRWQKQFFENGAAAFDKRPKKTDARTRQLEQRAQKLQAKLARKDEVIGELSRSGRMNTGTSTWPT